MKQYASYNFGVNISNTPQAYITRELIESSLARNGGEIRKLKESQIDAPLCELALNGGARLGDIPTKYLTDRLIIVGLKKTPNEVCWLLSNNRYTPEMLEVAIDCRPLVIQFFNPKMLNYLGYCMRAVAKDGHSLAYVKGTHPELYEPAVRSNGSAIRYVPENDRLPLYELAVQQCGAVLLDVPEGVTINNVPEISVVGPCLHTLPCKHNVVIGTSQQVLSVPQIYRLLMRWDPTNDMLTHFIGYAGRAPCNTNDHNVIECAVIRRHQPQPHEVIREQPTLNLAAPLKVPGTTSTHDPCADLNHHSQTESDEVSNSKSVCERDPCRCSGPRDVIECRMCQRRRRLAPAAATTEPAKLVEPVLVKAIEIALGTSVTDLIQRVKQGCGSETDLELYNLLQPTATPQSLQFHHRQRLNCRQSDVEPVNAPAPLTNASLKCNHDSYWYNYAHYLNWLLRQSL